METTIDIDTGGTFTDGAVRRGSEVQTLKTPTTPHDLTVCFSDIIEQAAESFGQDLREFLASVDCIRYSTTIGTNAVIERAGAEVGVLAPQELLDRLEQQDKELLSDIIARGGTRELRTAADPRTVSKKYNELAGELCDNIVVGLGSLDEERRVRETLNEEQPRHFLGSVPVHLSFELSNDLDDDRRLVTTLLDSYLHPSLGDFLYKAEDFLRDNGYDNPLLIFCNDGTTTRVAKTTSIRTYNSGPSAGIQGASEIAELYDEPNVVTLDIGGTSADIAVIADGQIDRDEFGEIDDVQISFPMRKLFPVSGGGGTIAAVEDGQLKLGPESAGANPGPACYGLGGQRPTVTDANVVSGIMSPEFFADDEISLDAERAERAISEHIAEPLGVTTEEAALKIRDRLEQQLGSFIAERINEAGMHPEDTTLVVYGGAGPTHACGVAAYAGVDKVTFPAHSSVFSAYSVGFSDLVHDYHIMLGTESDLEMLESTVNRTQERARRDMEGEGFDVEDVKTTWSVRGITGTETTLLGEVDIDDATTVLRDQLEEYEQVDLMLTATAALPTHEFADRFSEPVKLEPLGTTEIAWQMQTETVVRETPVFDFTAVDGAMTKTGPAVLRDSSTTYAIPPEWTLEVDPYGNMITKEAQ